MDFKIHYLSFFLVRVDDKEENKRAQHFRTLDEAEYESSPLKDFLDGEFAKIVKRKAERHPKAEQVPTKIGFFTAEPGHDLTSNPNYNLFAKARSAFSLLEFQEASEQFASLYVQTSAARGGVFIVAKAQLRKYFDDPFVFVLKCDFEPKVASISDASSLIEHVELAITTKNMKSIQYPYMPEEGMIEEGELKIHQASHARYFEDFLKYVGYEQSMPEIVKTQVMDFVRETVIEDLEDESPERAQFEEAMEIWAESPKRELQERFSTEEIVEVASRMVEHTPELELKMKLDHMSVKAMLSDFGESVHLAKIGDRYVVLMEADSVVFEKGFSPIEFHKPEELDEVVERIREKHGSFSR
ncbi:DUF3900 domain-containing protein [Bacillus badius]|uniref:DUF3900 domain-containing protein n=1 Tax=Bacillus badius TaxID=1455 RepID=UPI0007B098B1|nr:DUF3900 domain-containing protein [Bacillus badius]KZN99708.1 hypothetical protein A4244_17070 [Bacillus badius]MED0666495.1 DUF3900 domain-containing protein [Bacillus badius]OCS85812.1 hypothetical protein A6M11_17085 [Bacillus badius]OVE51830.1 hypothetical protein B1A98_09745 [Bacillus badius]TDW03256.1 uncharacterized protein DUF3898 [Bacillus badius]